MQSKVFVGSVIEMSIQIITTSLELLITKKKKKKKKKKKNRTLCQRKKNLNKNINVVQKFLSMHLFLWGYFHISTPSTGPTVCSISVGVGEAVAGHQYLHSDP